MAASYLFAPCLSRNRDIYNCHSQQEPADGLWREGGFLVWIYGDRDHLKQWPAQSRYIDLGADPIEGAPYVFYDPADRRRLIGFEVEIAEAIARLMGVRAFF